ncbi:right-handed parallel beta-helix repeat-containing protein [Streptomyces turgidiscabies]|uniref:right-handed parallel beta-helix repeat-containing protein n=1 Tax=Streptomyces turgidiscabies TaxID=85558 RepID=UPI0038F65D8E
MSVPSTPALSGTNFRLEDGQGGRFEPGMPVTLAPPNIVPTPDNSEIGYLTDVQGDELTVTRAQEGSSAKAVAAGWVVYGAATRKTFEDLEEAVLASAPATELEAHLQDHNNPHQVTKTQVGLSNVDNTSDASKPVSTATQTALNAKADQSSLTAHTSNTSNPHSVTKSQVGLGNVDNTSDANKPISTATQTALNAKANKSYLRINVKDYGALGNTSADDTAAIQAAIDAATVKGGEVFFPAGVYLIYSALEMKTNVSLIGEGATYNDRGSTIRQMNTTAHGLYMNIVSSDGGHFRIEGLNVSAGPGHSSGNGIYLRVDPAGTRPVYFNVRISGIHARDFAGWGTQIDGGIVCTIEKSLFVGNANGVFINGDPVGNDTPFPTTSTSISECYFNRNLGIGLKLKNVNYSGIYSCAADHNDIHYQLIKCQSVAMYNCGAEYHDADTPVNGIGYDIQGCVGVNLYSCFMYKSKITTVKVSSYTSVLGAVQNCFQIGLYGFIDSEPLANSVTVNTSNNLSIDNCSFPGTIVNNGSLLRPSSLKVDNSGLVTTQGTILPDSNRLYQLGSGAFEWDAVRAGQIRLTYTDALYLANSSDVVLGTGVGSRIGTSATQKLAFFGATPVAQQGATVGLGTVLSNLGLRAAGTAFPITTTAAVATGALTPTGNVLPGANQTYDIGSVSAVWNRVYAGAIRLYYGAGLVFEEGSSVSTGTVTGTKIGTSTTQKLAFFNATPIVQPTGSVLTALSNLGLVASPTIADSDITKSISTKTAAYTLTTADSIVTGNATGGAFSLTLPTAVGIAGRSYTLKKIDASGNAVTVATTSSQTIDASTTYSLAAQYKYVTVVSDGANWLIVGNN